ncbi:MAG: DUF1015 domain-containing protein [Spirochaetaceae bacterium]|nr:DUF1015 domain-containing protein [Spirochaetaceae bacterium]
MSNAKERLSKLALHPADIMLPKKGIDLNKWAVVACDQYTSNRAYWERVKAYIASYPSTLPLIFPEVYLEDGRNNEIIENINKTMKNYVDKDIFDSYKSCFFLVKRTVGGKSRLGLIATLDLDKYDFSANSTSLIRATEGTILSRIPPRKAIRQNAPLELPHIMVLIDDKEKTLIEPFSKTLSKLKKVYDTPLMEKGGEIQGYLINNEEAFASIASALEGLYNKLDPANPLLFAMGDGNHSLATAKSCWEDIKKNLSIEELLTHPARFALVEIENIHDEGLEFEPIHRVLFNLDKDEFENLLIKHCSSFTATQLDNKETLKTSIEELEGQTFGFATKKDGILLYKIVDPEGSIAAGTIQLILDEMVEKNIGTLDYIHGFNEAIELGTEDNNIAILMPEVLKSTFFDAIIKDKALPRKTFSMGEANEKRYYLEARSLNKN